MATTKARKKPVKNKLYGAYKARRLPIYFDSIDELQMVRDAARIERLAVSRFIVRVALAEADRITEAEEKRLKSDQ
jgi:uncharacterized protein (DUF1778 family)